jgi:hypothetical protein
MEPLAMSQSAFVRKHPERFLCIANRNPKLAIHRLERALFRFGFGLPYANLSQIALAP